MSPNWQSEGDFMKFASMADCTIPVMAIAYRFPDRPDEVWTRRFADFKFGSGSAKGSAIRGACAALPAALGTIRFLSPVSLICAIASRDTLVDVGCALAMLGTAIAGSQGWSWKPEMLRKKVHQPLHLANSGPARGQLVRGVYEAGPVPGRTAVILDDFATRGSTIGEIARAVHATNPRIITCGLVLGVNERAEYWAGRGQAISNEHVPKRLSELWARGSRDVDAHL